MSIFADYSKYYDLLYQDKDYNSEVGFIDGLLKQYAKQPKTLLELGSGTGKHACLLAKKDYHVVGIDQSRTMLEMAGHLLAQEPQAAKQIRLFEGDVRTFEIKEQFDAAISLFHVLSYQTSNHDVEQMFETVKKHVKPSGIFIFDCWYGPAVLNQKPVVRYKRLENEILAVERVAVPTIDENANTVNVHYHLFVQEKPKLIFQKMEEDHLMRYYFLPELERICAAFSMKIELACEWLTQEPLSQDTWGACFVVRV
ncbi:methyltransferase domain-containing protein [Candidatus Berkiella aquae]|uniref:Class I SAM-dependent methyltransferase n=1 Tax=Candidatus Berkiella aquae TaxID=295108 RepID=A0A0Q9YIA2_9GAMM|nr:methyltransferase domain-containing protein [Candidatus Berkiella aquae]MCS5712313.1 class I SAM-dependent methyltransferase [Candidatus Berkiella aquae]